MMSSTNEPAEELAATPSGAPDEVAAPVDSSPKATLSFPVVGIGASAGGVDALQSFFSATSPSSGMAFIVIQHLSADHDSLMAEILGRCTTMPVREIEDRMPVEPNHVYVIRPGFTITLEGPELRMGEPVEKRGHRRPVDDFFRSLAREQKETAIAVVLSGTGTNGSAGAQAIKAAGGLCIAQDPDSADFPGMPLSLIHAGYADLVLKPPEMPDVLMRYVHNPYIAADSAGRTRAIHELERHRQDLDDVISIVRARTKHDFQPYKAPTVLRRIQRRMGLRGIADLKGYAARLRAKPEEAEELANDLMINVTGFFRDAEAWEALREAVVRPLVDQKGTEGTIRAWVSACASGEEPYSLGMLIAEEIERAGANIEVKIFATDTADKSLAFARAGVFPGGIEGDLSPERLQRFFDKDEHTYRIKKNLRDQVVFAPQDVLRDPPFSRLDIATCRNLLIYLEPEAQRRTLALLHFALRDGGYLFLGNSESLGETANLFEVVSKRWRIFRRTGPSQHRFSELPAIARRLPEAAARSPSVRSARAQLGESALIESALLAEFGPPTAVVDANERIIYFHGNAEPYLQHPSGQATQSLVDLARPSVRPLVRNALRRAIADNRAVTVEAETDSSGSTRIAITASPLKDTRLSRHYFVTFTQKEPDAVGGEHASPPVRPPRNIENDAALEEELADLRRELQTSVEAFEATNEELKASNEEVTSTNEELQSSNEELETGKEELQSLNEELLTVNTQLETKVNELEATTNDLDNLLSSTDIAVVFLDPQMRVRRFTAAVQDLLELLPADIGRPVAHLAQKFTDGDLIADATSVLAKLVPLESEVLSHSARWYLKRTQPYRTQDNHIGGVVITFVDITIRKRSEQAITANQARLQAVVEQMPAAVLLAEAQSGELLLANRQATNLFNQNYPLPLLHHSWAAAYAALRGVHKDGRAYELEEWPLARTLSTGEVISDEELDFLRPDGSLATVAMSCSPVRNIDGALVAAVAVFWDVTERKREREAMRDSEERFRRLVEGAHDYAMFLLDRDGRVVSWNKGAERVIGYREEDILGRSGAVIFTPEDRAAGAPEEEMREAAVSERAIDERWHLRKDGTRFWASGVMTAARNDDGTVRGFVKIMRDQTDRKSMDAQLQEALLSAQQLRARAEGANRAKDEFISTVSHELRTPLNTIRLWSRMFMGGKVQGQDVVQGAQFIDRAALAQQQLIDDLLDVSRMATGQLRLSARNTRLIQSVEAAIDAVRVIAAVRRIEVKSQLSSDVGTVRVDPDRIQQVVWNLLSNAVKFTPDGGRVDVTMRRQESTVEIVVRDTGAGIRPEFLPHVFDRFRQGDATTTRRFAGVGLGLAIAKQLVELHDGTIVAHSDGEGKGATFTVYLPLERQLPGAEDHEATGNFHEWGHLNGIEVLLVDDEKLGREATAKLLEQYGAQVRAASSAAQAREAYQIRRPDVIVADIGMPNEDGNALLVSLRNFEEQQKLPRVPAVAVTAFARSEDRALALASGFDEHLPKPIDADGLVEIIMRLRSTGGR
jgi:two-component system CheB/CheR fusion protein